MKPLVYCVASRGWKGWTDCMKTWFETASTEYSIYVCMGLDVVPAMQSCYEETKEPILGYLHDDVIIHEKDWDLRVLKEFEDESVGLVSFTGALGHGRPDLYRVPYHLPDLARQTFISNMRDAEIHGARFKGSRDVAIADGSTCFVRRAILHNWNHIRSITQTLDDQRRVIDSKDVPAHKGGFPQGVPCGYFMWMENLCCEVRRQGFRIRMVGVDFTHLGGKTSAMHTTEDRQKQYEAEHKYFYERNRDVLPYRVPE
jgi:hypothetical protein